jgi:LacI family transcriptional regulator
MQQKSRGRVTQREIGQQLGVSQTLVGYALNGNGRISPELRERIVSEAQKLGYRPNKAARALRSGRSQLVALWLPPGASPFFGLVLDQFQRLAERDGYDLVTTSGRTLQLSQWPLDGILLHDDVLVQVEQGQRPGLVRRPEEAVTPRVAFGHQLHRVHHLEGTVWSDYIAVELFDVACQAVESLIKAGCQKLAFIGAQSISEASEPRLRAFREVIRKTGVDGVQIVVPDSPTLRQESKRVLEAHLRCGTQFDGLFCGNDDVALGALRALRAHQLQVPHDVRVIGCDGLPDGADAEPPLSTIALPLEELCDRAWQTLLWRIENPDAPTRREMLAANLLWRESA